MKLSNIGSIQKSGGTLKFERHLIHLRNDSQSADTATIMKTPFARSCRILPSKIAPTSARRESAVTIDSNRDADDDAAEPETKDHWSMRDGG